MSLVPRDPDFAVRLQAIFEQAAFVRDVGIELVSVSPGVCETRVVLAPRHFQQDDVVHAGVAATTADHTAGAAAATLISADERVLTSSFTIQLLRPGRGAVLTCRAHVLRAGRALSSVQSDVYVDGVHTATMLATIAVVAEGRLKQG
jgi:uncharacterized protein (TIGR00369 family)